MSTPPVPKAGQEIYVPSAWYLSRGRDDICGGKAKVERTEFKFHTRWVYVVGISKGFNWAIIGEDQAKMADEYGEQQAHPCPDDHPSANTGGL